MSLAVRLTEPVEIRLAGRSWRLVMTYGALLDCQEASGIDMLNGVEAFLQTSAKTLRCILWALLRRVESSVTPEQVGAMVMPQDLLPIRQAISAAFAVSTPEPLSLKRKPIGGLLAKPMTWMQTAALARMELRLTEAEFLEMTPRYFHELREVSVSRMRREELLTGMICEVVVNFSQCRPKKPVKASDWLMHKPPEDQPLDFGEQMLRELQKFEL